MSDLSTYQIPNPILNNSYRIFFFSPAKHTYRYQGYLSDTARSELERAGNEVLREDNCWIIRYRGVEQ